MRQQGETMEGSHKNLHPGDTNDLYPSIDGGKYRTHKIENRNGQLFVDGREYNPDDTYPGVGGRLYRITYKVFGSGQDAVLQVDTENV